LIQVPRRSSAQSRLATRKGRHDGGPSTLLLASTRSLSLTFAKQNTAHLLASREGMWLTKDESRRGERTVNRNSLRAIPRLGRLQPRAGRPKLRLLRLIDDEAGLCAVAAHNEKGPPRRRPFHSVACLHKVIVP
jgi:hypothetical protein